VKNDKKERTLHRQWYSPKNGQGRPYLDISVDVVEIDDQGRCIVEFDKFFRDIHLLDQTTKGEPHEED